MSFLWFLILNAAKDLLAINVLTALIDHGIADLSNEDHKSSRCVVVW